MFSRWRRKSRWQGVDYLELVPRRRYGSEEDAAMGRTVVLMPRYTDPLFGRFLQPRLGPDKAHIRVPLEERGALLWPLIDGTRTVRELAGAVRDGFPEDADRGEERVSMYLHAMYEHKFIEYVNFPA